MLTVTVEVAVPTVPVGGGVTVVVGVVVTGGGCTTGFVATAKLPRMPAPACPSSVQRKAYWPFFVTLTVSLAVLPGASNGVFLPLILKSWAILPLLLTVKMTVPIGALSFENLYLNSEALTVIFVITTPFWATAFCCTGAAPPPAANTPVAPPATANRPSTNSFKLRRI